MIVTEHWLRTLEDVLLILADFHDGLPIIVLYVRVSSDIQVDEGYSLETQAEALRQECARRWPDGYHIIFLVDEGLSGALWWRRDGSRSGHYRPGLTLLKELVELGVVHAAGVYRCNRFTRKLRIWLEFEEDYLDAKNVLFFSAAECIDTADDSSRMVFRVLMSGAEYELGQIAGGVKDGLKKRRSEGYYVGCPPYGWRWQDERLIPEGCRMNIEPVPEEADVIRRIYDYCLDGLTPGRITATLTSEGVPTATGGTVWTKCVLKHILRDPTNAGLIRDGDGGLAEGLHYSHRIIEPETFHHVQEILASRREAARDNNRPQGLVFDGMLACGICGSRLQVSSPNGEVAHYVCRGRKAHHPHNWYWLRVDLVENRMQKVILESAAAHAASTRAAARLRQQSEEHDQEMRRTIRRLNDRLTRNHDDICLWAGRMGDADYDQGEIESELAWLADQRRKIEDELTRVKTEAKRCKSRKAKCKTASSVAANLVKLWDRATVAEKRELMPHLVENLTCEPTAAGVTVHIGFVSGDLADVQFYVRAKVSQDCGDLWAIGPWLLTTAYYLQQGLTVKEIAVARGITAGRVAAQVSQLRRLTGVKDLALVLEKLAPVLDARADELHIDGRQPPQTGRRPRKWT